MSVYSWENKKRSNRKQTPKGAGVWEELGIDLKVLPMLIINTHSTELHCTLSSRACLFSLCLFIYSVLGGCRCRGWRTTSRSQFSPSWRRFQGLKSGHETWPQVPLPDWAIFQVFLPLFLREKWFTHLQIMEIVVVFWLILYIWASALWNHYSYILGNNCLILELEVSSPKFTSFH